MQHVPGFIQNAEELKSKGIDEILLISGIFLNISIFLFLCYCRIKENHIYHEQCLISLVTSNWGWPKRVLLLKTKRRHVLVQIDPMYFNATKRALNV